MENDLKPCPFCGSDNVRRGTYRQPAHGGAPADVFVRCNTCRARGPEVSEATLTRATPEDDARRLWDERRAPEPIGKATVAKARCDGCKHWLATGVAEDDPMSISLELELAEQPEPGSAPQAPHRRCKKLVHLYKRGTSRTDTTRPAYLMDASGYKAHLWTRPDFGCSAFEEKT